MFIFTSCAERYSTRKRVSKIKINVNVASTTKKSSGSHTETKKKVVLDKKDNIPARQVSVVKPVDNKPTTNSNTSKKNIVIDTALSYLGTPYKYGGTTPKGFDCSGFVGASFKPVNISLHRSSHEMANQGKHVDLKNVQVGDLLFFVTGKNKRISHVGIVVENEKEIKFIHSSTSRGVIISSMNEGYWSKAYRKARRVM